MLHLKPLALPLRAMSPAFVVAADEAMIGICPPVSFSGYSAPEYRSGEPLRSQLFGEMIRFHFGIPALGLAETRASRHSAVYVQNELGEKDERLVSC